jgi:hypothetical protein
MPKQSRPQNRYAAIVEKLFLDRYKIGKKQLLFERADLVSAASALKIALPNNPADILYSHRYRANMPTAILKTQPTGKEWIISGAGKSKYRFELVSLNKIEPNLNLSAIKIPDATPEIIAFHSLSDEQSLLAKVRCNRLVDIFLGITAYSLQNHLRTSVKDIGQIEIDELYVGIDRRGRQFIVPVQAKRGSDKLGSVQIRQDIEFCARKFAALLCRPIAAQFLADDLIALFELVLEGEQVKIVDERHYLLVAAGEISDSELAGYNARS